MSLEPVIFDNPAELEAAIDSAVSALRRADARRFRVLADDYELQAVRAAEICERERLDGIAGGLKVAAALIETAAEVAA